MAGSSYYSCCIQCRRRYRPVHLPIPHYLQSNYPVVVGSPTPRWPNILPRQPTPRSFTLSKSNNRKSKTTRHTTNSTFSGSKHDMSPKLPPAAFLGTEKTVETVISAGSTLADQRS